MKKIFLIIILLTIAEGFAQTPIYSLFTANNYGQISGAYYKDINNDLNNFEGTWEFVNGSTSLKIVLQKKSSITMTLVIYLLICL